MTKEMLVSCRDKSAVSNGNSVHPAGFRSTFVCSGKGVGEVTGVEWFKHPTRSGSLLDTDESKLALSNFLYNSECLTTRELW